MSKRLQDRFEQMRQVLIAKNRFYRERLATGMPFSELPFTTKTELVEDQAKYPPYGRNLTFPIESYVRLHETSGTTGKSLLWLDTRESWDCWIQCWEQVYRGACVGPGDRVYVAFSFGPFIGFWAAFEAAQRMGMMVLSGGGQSTSQRLRAIIDRAATVLVCTPTYALRMAEVAANEGIDCNGSSIRVTIHAGEPGAGIPQTRQRIQDAWGARTYDHVGMTEMGAYGFECGYQAGIHVNEDEFIAEVVDPQTLTLVPDGQKGELVLTNLGRVGMPLIRYRTGDLVMLSRELCRCGRSYARLLGGVLGRADDMITVRGINVFPSAIENIVRAHREVVEFSIEVFRHRQMHELSIQVELQDGADPTGIVEKLGQDLHNHLHVRASVAVVPPGQLPRFELKARRIQVLD